MRSRWQNFGYLLTESESTSEYYEIGMGGRPVSGGAVLVAGWVAQAVGGRSKNGGAAEKWGGGRNGGGAVYIWASARKI